MECSDSVSVCLSVCLSLSLSKDNTPKLSPKEILGNISIPQRASLLLIGDSVIRHINPRRFATLSEWLYKVCVPDVTTRDLCAWVHSLPIMRSVKAVTLHVGINDCPAGQISQSSWYELIALLKKVFPNASHNTEYRILIVYE